MASKYKARWKGQTEGLTQQRRFHNAYLSTYPVTTFTYRPTDLALLQPIELLLLLALLLLLLL